MATQEEFHCPDLKKRGILIAKLGFQRKSTRKKKNRNQMCVSP